MQQISTLFFCDWCGAANELEATHCCACQQALSATHATDPVSQQETAAQATLTTANQAVPGDCLPGTVLLGRYRVRQEIGSGGFSTVYLTDDILMGNRPVAVKRISLQTLTPRQMIDATETYHREEKTLTLLQGVEGVPRFYESFTDAENWYIAMEYIAGQTLDEYLQTIPGGYLPETQVIEFGQKLAAILQRMHQPLFGVVFRDVKPANIMLTPAGQLYLIDFGIARFFSPGQKKDTTPLGTPGFAAPEQFGISQTDIRTDIYGLGMTLQTLLTGHDPLELARGHQPRNPQQPSRRLRRLLEQMTERKIERRISSMHEVESRLRHLQRFALPTGHLGSPILAKVRLLLPGARSGA